MNKSQVLSFHQPSADDHDRPPVNGVRAGVRIVPKTPPPPTPAPGRGRIDEHGKSLGVTPEAMWGALFVLALAVIGEGFWLRSLDNNIAVIRYQTTRILEATTAPHQPGR